MLCYAVVIDYVVFYVISAVYLFILSWRCTRHIPVRPHPMKSTHKHFTRTVMQAYAAKATLHALPKLFSYLLIWCLILMSTTNAYIVQSTSAHIWVTEITWYLCFIIFCVILLSWWTYTARIIYGGISTDTAAAAILVFMFFPLYFITANIFMLVLILECQSAALMFFLTLNVDLVRKTTDNTTLASIKLTRGSFVVNILTLHYWVSFAGALLLLLFSGLMMTSLGVLHWWDVVHFINLYRFTHITHLKLNFICILIVLGLMLKIGAFPFHFWKPELVRNLSLPAVFLYSTPYAATIIFAATIVLCYMMYAAPTTIIIAIWLLSIAAIYVFATILIQLTEMKVFLAYTSGLHMLYICLALVADKTPGALAWAYCIIYIMSTLTMFTGLLSFRRCSIKYLSDIQILTHVPAMIFWFSAALATMAGVPPLAGFWVKFITLARLWKAGEFVLTIHLLCVSMIFMYFYLALYRFMGATNVKFDVQRTLLVKSQTIINIGIFTAILHICGVWYMCDILNLTTLLSNYVYGNL